MGNRALHFDRASADFADNLAACLLRLWRDHVDRQMFRIISDLNPVSFFLGYKLSLELTIPSYGMSYTYEETLHYTPPSHVVLTPALAFLFSYF